MVVKEIGVANFKSFDPDGVKISLEKRINFFIGKNNSGKSNFLRFLKLFSDYYDNWKKLPQNDLESQYKRNGQNPTLIVTLSLAEIWEKYAAVFGKDNLYTFKFLLPNFEVVDKNPLEDFNESFLINLQRQYSSAPKSTLLSIINPNISYGAVNSLDFLKKLIYIPHFREVDDSKDVAEKTFDGKKIISKLFEMQNPRIGEESNREKFNKIQNFVKGLLNEDNLTLVVPHTKDRIIIEMNNNRLSLESYGTGLHELIILCSAITIYDDFVFCIEEPELHLHPELQRKFLDYLLTLKNYFFISTHSNIFIDYNPNVNVFHVVQDNNATRISQSLSNSDSYEILNDLGYKASDILQSNGILWVEGPSDRTYLNKWISLITNELIEGIHYSVMFYGGRLLSHLTLEDEDNELIKLLRINRNAIVIIDRDGINSSTKINETKTRIQNETSEGNCWITKGREIENYLAEETVLKYLATYASDLKFKYDKNKKLGDNILNSNKKLKLNYDSNKTKFSKEIVGYISEDDMYVLDLKTRMKHVISQIGIWNK